MGQSKSSLDEEVHSDTSLPKKKKKRKETFQTSNLTVHLQELGEQQQQAQSMRKEGNIQDQSRIK